ncbi:MAG: hypothetical protein RJB13_512, partial [Pseudomonadota bacterium]
MLIVGQTTLRLEPLRDDGRVFTQHNFEPDARMGCVRAEVAGLLRVDRA